MAPRFPASWVDRVYSAANIVDVVTNYVPLQKRGLRHWGLCPFHNEKTPSFSVNPELNLYYCFGCKASGNIVQFVMEMEKLTYPEALLYLAKQFNLPPPVIEDDPMEEQRRNLRERLYEVNREAAIFYHEQLWLPENSKALEYLHNRGLDDAVIRRFGLGVSPDEWDSLLNHLQSKGFTVEEMQQAALITVKENTRYDVFRDRIMFPIINRYGQTIGFGARAMGSAQPKYLNTSDSLVFNKRYNVYGINLLKKLRNLRQLYLVEGYLDVITLSQYGFANAVATLGTALTNEQVRLIKNYAPEIWIAYDGDEAGQMATLRALDILDQEAVPGQVLCFPDQLDPDDFLHRDGAEGFTNLKPIRNMAFRLTRLQSRFDLSHDDQKREFAKEACKLLQILKEPVELDYYLGKISLKTGIEKEVLLAQVRKSRSGVNPDFIKQPLPKKQTRQAVRFDQSEFMLAALLATGKLPQDLIKPDDFEDEQLKAIVLNLLAGKTPAFIMEELPDEETRAMAGELFNRFPDLDRDATLSAAEDCLKRIRQMKLETRIKQLIEEIKHQEGEQKAKSLQLITVLQAELKK